MDSSPLSHLGKLGEQRTGTVIEEKGKLGGAVINKESIEGNWEIRVQWFFIVQVVIVSLTRLLRARRNSFLFWRTK